MDNEEELNKIRKLIKAVEDSSRSFSFKDNILNDGFFVKLLPEEIGTTTIYKYQFFKFDKN